MTLNYFLYKKIIDFILGILFSHIIKQEASCPTYMFCTRIYIKKLCNIDFVGMTSAYLHNLLYEIRKSVDRWELWDVLVILPNFKIIAEYFILGKIKIKHKSNHFYFLKLILIILKEYAQSSPTPILIKFYFILI